MPATRRFFCARTYAATGPSASSCPRSWRKSNGHGSSSTTPSCRRRSRRCSVKRCCAIRTGCSTRLRPCAAAPCRLYSSISANPANCECSTNSTTCATWRSSMPPCSRPSSAYCSVATPMRLPTTRRSMNFRRRCCSKSSRICCTRATCAGRAYARRSWCGVLPRPIQANATARNRSAAARVESEPPLTDPGPGVAEHPHPAAVLARIGRPPGVLCAAIDALRMRHRDRDAAVGRGQRGNPVHRTVRIGWIAARSLAVMGHVTERDQAVVEAVLQVLCRVELRSPFAVCDRNRQARTVHAGQQHRGRIEDLDQTHAALELLRAIASELRPVLRAGYQFPQDREHLATIADTEREAVGACEEALEFQPGALVIQDRARPAPAGAEHVPIGEGATGEEARETGQGD